MRTVIVGSASTARKIIQTADCADVVSAPGVEDADALVGSADVDAVVVLHDMSGHPDLYALLGRIRDRRPGALVVTDGPSRSDQRVEALNWGIDACLAPPADPDEIIATLRALDRSRNVRQASRTLTVGSLEIDVMTRDIRVGGLPLVLRPRDFDILTLLARTPGVVVSRSTILDEIWEPGYDGLSNLVDVHVATIRSAVKKVGGPPLIETVRGVGYRLIDHEEITP